MRRDYELIAANIYLISDYKLDNYYLVVGESQALAIDCGCGIGNAMNEIRAITDLPLACALTHGHMDHCGNAYQFPQVYMNPRDDGLSQFQFGDRETVAWYIATRVPGRFPGPGHVEALQAMIPDDMPDTFDHQPVEDGHIFDLGGISVEALHTPGHTPGSMCYLIPEARIICTGDAMNASSIIPNKPGGTRDEIRQFRDSLKKVRARSDDFDHLAVGHEGPLYDVALIDDYLTLCNGLLDGSLWGDYEEKGIRKGKVVRYGIAELWYEADA